MLRASPYSSAADTPHRTQSKEAICTPIEETMIVFFDAGSCSLTNKEIGALAQWVQTWNSPKNRCRLYLGGADETSRANRLRRLSVLTSVLEYLGVPRKAIQADGEWFKASRMGIIDDLPADTIWLQVKGTLEHFLLPVDELGRQHGY